MEFTLVYLTLTVSSDPYAIRLLSPQGEIDRNGWILLKHKVITGYAEEQRKLVIKLVKMH